MERLGDDIDRTLTASGGGAVVALAEIAAVWPTAVGTEVARQAWPLRLARDGTLHVATSSATWAFELDRLAPDIEERLRARLGASAPAALRFRVGPIPEPGALVPDVSGPPADVPDGTPETEAAAVVIAGEIEDPVLREIVAKAARTSLARARSDRGF